MRSLVLASILAAVLSGGPAFAVEHDVDDSGINTRDRDERTVIPTDQGGSAADRDVTSKIRKAVVQDESLSMNAHNVKIITKDGVVTLRGPVKNAAEKASVVAKAKQVSGVKRVDDRLEIEKN